MKATALEASVPMVRNQVGKDTVILSVLNGITSEAVIGNILGMEHVYCVAQGMDAVKMGNELTYSHMGQICIGIPNMNRRKRQCWRRSQSCLSGQDFLYQGAGYPAQALVQMDAECGGEPGCHGGGRDLWNRTKAGTGQTDDEGSHG